MKNSSSTSYFVIPKLCRFTLIIMAVFVSGCVSGLESLQSWRSKTELPNDEEAGWLQSSDVSALTPIYSYPEKAAALRVPTRDRKISVSVVSLPVSDILTEVATQADLTLSITGEFAERANSKRITLHALHQSAEEIVELLAAQAGFAWDLEGKVLSVFADVPRLKTYPVNYLNIKRSTQSSVGLATQVGSISLNPQASTGAGSHSNNSRTQIENIAVNDFWTHLETDLQTLVLSSGETAGGVGAAAALVVNREAGLVTVRGRQKQHRDIADYLQEVLSSVNRQVLIEATVVEINLSDSHRAGIDWSFISNGDGLSWSQQLHGQKLSSSISGVTQNTPSALLSFVKNDTSVGSLSATLDLLNEFGDIQILSKPRIMALNNQSAVLKVVDNRVYFSVNVERQNGEDKDEITTKTQIHTVPVGLVMNVIPFIGRDDQIVLNVRPTISRILGFVNDPNPELGLSNVNNGVPEIQVREMESILRLRSGQMAVIGGLMQATSSEGRSGVPFLSDLPVLGSFFSKQRKSSGKTELLVFLKPTVISRGEGAV